MRPWTTLALALAVACGGEAPPADDAATHEEATHEEAAATEAPDATEEATHEEEAVADVTPDAEGWKYYGVPFTVDERITANALLGAPDAFVDKTVRVEGLVTDVCQGKGCWMVITDDEHHMRVLMKDHAFGVDKKGSGNWCEVEGLVQKTQLDPEKVAHFQSEAAEGKIVPEAEAKDGIVYELVATSVRMKAM